MAVPPLSDEPLSYLGLDPPPRWPGPIRARMARTVKLAHKAWPFAASSRVVQQRLSEANYPAVSNRSVRLTSIWKDLLLQFEDFLPMREIPVENGKATPNYWITEETEADTEASQLRE